MRDWSPKTRRVVLVAAAVTVVVAASAVLGYRLTDEEPGERADEPEVATTDRSMAAALIEQVDRDPTSQGPHHDLQEYAPDAVGAIVNFDADVLSLAGVATSERSVFTRTRCDRPDSNLDGCREELLDDGTVVRTSWQEAVPEEDPGVVSLEVRREDQVVALAMYGPKITGDPESMDDLPMSMEQLTEIATDPAFGVRTSKRLVGAGKEIDDWGRAS